MMIVSKDKQYRTRDGREVRIYAVDGGSDFPIHGAYWEPTIDEWILCRWNLDGLALSVYPELDLVEVNPRIQREYWINVPSNPHEYADAYLSKESCDSVRENYFADHFKACVKVTIDCEEGEGL